MHLGITQAEHALELLPDPPERDSRASDGLQLLLDFLGAGDVELLFHQVVGNLSKNLISLLQLLVFFDQVCHELRVFFVGLHDLSDRLAGDSVNEGHFSVR